MTAFLIDDARELRRWLLSGAIVLAMHGGLAAAMVTWQEPDESDDPTSALVVDLAPMPMSPDVSPMDLPPGPEQVQADAAVQHEAQKIEDAPEEKVDTQVAQEEQPELAPAENPDVVMAQPPPKVEKEVPTPAIDEIPAEATTAPQVMPVERGPVAAAPVQAPAAVANPNAIPNWKRQIATQLERNKRYPAAAQERNQKGTAQLVFSLDRQGRVMASRIVRSSGSVILDQETLALVQRAQPFPPPPPNMPGAQVELNVPVRFEHSLSARGFAVGAAGRNRLGGIA